MSDTAGKVLSGGGKVIGGGLELVGGVVKGTSDVIDAGKLGYCRFLKFKCAAARTCDAWVVGGPLTDD